MIIVKPGCFVTVYYRFLLSPFSGSLLQGLVLEGRFYNRLAVHLTPILTSQI